MLSARLLFVTGKGGVGKTTVAAALAVVAARVGRRVLLCELDQSGSLAATLESDTLSYAPREVRPGLFAMAMDTERSLEEYLRLQLRMGVLARIGPVARTFDFVATAAPGVREILTVGKLCWEVRERNYDLVIADAPATGHVIGQLDAPRAINSLVRVGRVRDQTAWMLELLSDPVVTGAVVVTTPEEMPVVETIELAARLQADTTVSLSAVVVNRALPELFTRAEAGVYEALAARPELLRDLIGVGVGPVFAAAHVATQRRRLQAEQLEVLRQALGVDTPLLFVPELFARLRGMRATTTIADRLAEEL